MEISDLSRLPEVAPLGHWARELSIQPATLKKAFQDSKLPGTVIDARVHLTRTDVLAWLGLEFREAEQPPMLPARIIIKR